MSMPAISERCQTVEQVRQRILAPKGLDPSWAAKMMQPVADCPIVADRMAYLVEKAKGNVVLDLGCTGPISAKMKAVAQTYYGVDATAGDWASVDFDHEPDTLPVYDDVNLIVMSELLEHLSNPGLFLEAVRVKYPGHAVIVTVPNAGAYQTRDGCELVNKDHVAWYSYTTIRTLLLRAHYLVDDLRWYHGQPHKAEGLIVLARTS